MKTNYINPDNPARFSKDPGQFALVADAQMTPAAMRSAARRRATISAKNASKERVDQQGRIKYTAATQPRNTDGKFRKILAQLKLNLGEEGTSELAKQIEATEAAQIAGNYQGVRDNSQTLIKMINSVKDGELPKGTTNNLRAGAQALGRVLAYLPLPQGNPNEKIRFSDLPPASADLVRKMVAQVKLNLAPDVAAKYVTDLDSFMTGSRTMSSDEMASNLNKLLRVLA